MKIAIIGAGAVGCYYGALLARAGHDVALVGRAPHVEAIQRDGLLLDTAAGRVRVAVEAGTDAAAVRGAHWVLCCVKSPDTETAGAQCAPYVEAEAAVFSLQNGVDNAERLAARLGRPVWPVVVYVAAAMAGPGHVRHHGRGELEIGPGPHAQAFRQVCGAAGVAVSVSPGAQAALWRKLVLNCAYNALSALARQPYGVLVRGEGVWAVMRDVVAECAAVAHARGIALPADTWAAVEAIAATMPGQSSSTAQDLARGRRSEIDHLNGYIVRQGEALGIATPANRVLYALVRLAEEAVLGRPGDAPAT